VGFLRDYNIPEPVTGGIAVALSDLRGPWPAVLAMRVLLTIGFVGFVVFRVLGRTYTAAVLGAGFALGATPTAIANMSSVPKRYGAAPLDFVVLPLVAALFFGDLANGFVIRLFVGL